jgi:succinate dehydrogenase/fumarate reductase cytochrome b subunit
MSPPAPHPESRARAERIFRITGVVPLAVFTLFHVGAYAVAPSRSHGFSTGWVGLVLELVLVLAPLVYHSGYGLVRLLRDDRRAATTLDQVQRWTSPLLLLFLFDHVIRLRWPVLSGLHAPEDVHALLVRELSSTWGGVPAVAAFHCMGTAVLSFHLGFGLYRSDFAASRGFSAPKARAWLGASVGLFVLLAGSYSIIGLSTGKSFPFV